MKRLISKASRTNTGSLAILMPCAILIACIGLGMFAMDVSHNITVRSELQNAADSAALAGAHALVDPKTENQAAEDALAVAADNTADGQDVSNSSKDTVVTANYDVNPSDNYGTCSVEAQMKIRNMFAGLIGHYYDDVKVVSKAIGYRSIKAIDQDQMFPLAVSVDTTFGNDKPINKMKVGDTFKMEINSQQFKNAAFTSFTISNPNAQWITDVVEQSLGMKPIDPGTVPGMEAGDQLNFINGVAQQKQLAQDTYMNELMKKDHIVIPVMVGDPPYNQGRQCVGWLTVKILNVKKNGAGGQVETITAKITKHVVQARGGDPNKGSNQVKDAMHDLSAGTVKLIPYTSDGA